MTFLSQLNEYIHQLNTFSIVLRMIFAIICGGIIGFERGRKGRPAGLRTHMLVCIGAALVMMINQYIVINLNPASDPGRMGAQVISGIGFLGAGSIIVTERHKVKGLTTAAGLWASACMGLAIGIGFYSGAIIGCILIILVITALNRLSKYLMTNSRYITVYIEFEAIKNIGLFLEEIKKHDIKIEDIEISRPSPKDQEKNSSVAIIDMISTKPASHADIITTIYKIEGVISVEEL